MGHPLADHASQQEEVKGKDVGNVLLLCVESAGVFVCTKCMTSGCIMDELVAAFKCLFC